MDYSLPGSSVHGFSRQEYWNGLPFPSPGDLPNPGIKPGSPALQEDSLPTGYERNPYSLHILCLLSSMAYCVCFPVLLFFFFSTFLFEWVVIFLKIKKLGNLLCVFSVFSTLLFVFWLFIILFSIQNICTDENSLSTLYPKTLQWKWNRLAGRLSNARNQYNK